MAKAQANKYIESVGRRKTSTARVRITPSTKTKVTVNKMPVDKYFTTPEQRTTAVEALDVPGITQDFEISGITSGGGAASQAESIRLGIARCLVEFDEELRPALKERGFLMRDPRVKERKKPGKKKARKSPQWSKR